MTAEFTEVGDDVFVLRYPVLDVNVTLVLGDDAALLVDTLASPAQAAELTGAIRAITGLPWLVANTHHHFDHTFGNGTMAGEPACPIWAHEETAALLRERPEAVRREAYAEALRLAPELAPDLVTAPIVAPNHTVHHESTLDVGGRPVVLRYLGRGHTAGDLVVHVPDADVLVAGDLVEEGAPPAFDDAYPLEWPQTVAALLRLTTPSTAVVPGHGAVVGHNFVRGQHEELAALEWVIRDGHADGALAEVVAAKAPFGPDAALVAVRRGYAELSGRV
ncbi:MBL fold metallo-hydrolase [Phytohabitans rumicis]|uniref:MBL fold metallo-hydrolase n=1 Tax=Phytohabitans rumicis TaxID=1076125 RepID=A0A6V8LBF9_9ACTN|nr:MBL fold metallo-hydrolase [Phytohabitans rumicis]GFJ92960.1 MBL fold metallo-hydrolase [Phytohabitans rumicis]